MKGSTSTSPTAAYLLKSRPLLPIARHDGQYKQGRDAKIIYIFNMVGATGIEPVTPTMST
jgi:hypothetical protein